MKKSIVVAFFISIAVLISGCGKLGESEAEKIIKDACKIPSSFKKLDYQVDEKNGLSYMDFTAKNPLGMDLKSRTYFVIRDKHIIPVDTDNIPENILRDFVSTNLDKFKECVIYYKDMKKLERDLEVPLKIMKEHYFDLDNNDNFFTWKSAAQQARKLNPKIKAYSDRYYESLPVVQKYFNVPPSYYKITVTGSYRDWNAHAEQTNDYPR